MSTTIHTPQEPSASPQTDGKNLRDIHLRDKTASILFFLICFIFLFTGCTRHSGVTFEGNITGADGRYLTISRTCAGETLFTDSVQIRNGSFALTVPAGDDGPDFYRISLCKDNAFTTIASKRETVHIEADASSLVRTYRATGSPDAKRMCQLDQRLALFADSTDQLSELYDYYRDNDSMRAVIESVYLEIRANHTTFLRDFIAQNSGSISCLAAFYQRYNQYRFFSEEENIQLLQNICTTLKSQYPNNGNVIWLEERLDKHPSRK